ncbi:hypothetical protein Csa_023077 [Cucumis sativus]|nr:hypothetical protein Csa_023077 [Cucumis sativus]
MKSTEGRRKRTVGLGWRTMQPEWTTTSGERYSSDRTRRRDRTSACLRGRSLDSAGSWLRRKYRQLAVV